MPTSLRESNICFEFPDGYSASKYDDWTFYRKQFNGCDNSAAVDFVVLDDDGAVCWLLEVKDFTTNRPDPNKAPLADIITHKVRDTLAGLLAAAMNASEDEQTFAQRAVRARQIRVCFHCERPRHGSRLTVSLPNAADLRQKLRKTLRAVDTKVEIADSDSPSPKVPWTATWQPQPPRTP